MALKADKNCLLRVLAGLPRKYLQCLVTLRSVYPLSPANNPYETLSSVTHAKHMHSIGHSSHISATIQTIANYIQVPHGPLGFICKCISNSNYIGFSICKVGTLPITRFFWTKVVRKDFDELSCGTFKRIIIGHVGRTFSS